MADLPTFDTALFRETLVADQTFSDGQAKVLTQAVTAATGHLPSRNRLDQFETKIGDRFDQFETKIGDRFDHLDSRTSVRLAQFESEFRAVIADRLADQTWKVTQLIVTAVLFNALVVAGAAIAVYNAVRP